MTDTTDTDGEETRRQTKPFAAFLQEHRDGALHAKASDLLAEVVAGVQEFSKQGKVTLEITVSPTKYDNAVEIVGVVKAKTPEAPAPAAMWYADDEGNVSRRDPRQLTLEDAPVRAVVDVDPTTREIRAVDTGTGEVATVG